MRNSVGGIRPLRRASSAAASTTLAVTGMRVLDHVSVAGHDLSGLQPEEAVEVVRPPQLVDLEVPVPAADPGEPLGALEQRLQDRLHPGIALLGHLLPRRPGEAPPRGPCARSQAHPGLVIASSDAGGRGSSEASRAPPRDEELGDRPSARLVARDSEDLLGLRIELDDHALVVERDQRHGAMPGGPSRNVGTRVPAKAPDLGCENEETLQSQRPARPPPNALFTAAAAAGRARTGGWPTWRSECVPTRERRRVLGTGSICPSLSEIATA